MKQSIKKTVIAYVHTHWDREWYREFEVFRLRLLRVFDNVLEMLQNNRIPSFYFDGQVVALLDYLEMRPEKEAQIREFIANKRLFIGPFYCLVDEFLTDGICFRKNLEIGLKISREFGCTDFIGYLADTFGHSENISRMLKEYGIDKAAVWRGVGDLPAEFIFNGINTVNLVRGYFMDIFSSEKSIEQKAQFLKDNLDKISQKSSDTLLLPIGADHLGVPENLSEQIEEVNKLLDDYNIKLGSMFDYFNKVSFRKKYSGELRNNSNTFILPGTYSARINLKQLNTECSYKLDLANKLQLHLGNKYANSIEYAYKLLLKNQAHDSICGCSTDDVHNENIIRFKKVLQIANTIIEETRLTQPQNTSISFDYPENYKILEVNRPYIDKDAQVLSINKGFDPLLLADTNKIPITEDYTNIYSQIKEINADGKFDLSAEDNYLQNSYIKIEVADGKINLYNGKNVYENFIEFMRYKDCGDTYNYGPISNDKGEIAQIKSAHIILNGKLRSAIKINTSFFSVVVSLNNKSKLLNFSIEWTNLLPDRLWQVRFNLGKNISETKSEDMNLLIKRKFDPEYNIRENLPKTKGLEAKTNTAPMQRFVWAEGLGVITKGLHEYEIFKNTLSVTLLRSTGLISKPENTSRTTPAGPPINVIGAQMLGYNCAEFSIGFIKLKNWEEHLEEVYPQTILF